MVRSAADGPSKNVQVFCMEAVGETSIETVLAAGQRVALKLKLRQPLMTYAPGRDAFFLRLDGSLYSSA